MTDTIERPRLKITYATLRNDNEELHEQFERGMEKARAQLGRHYPNFINGEARHGEGEFEDRSPIDDSLVLGYFAKGTRHPVAGARQDHSQDGGVDQRAPDGARRTDGP
jgi:hypothetical protein